MAAQRQYGEFVPPQGAIKHVATFRTVGEAGEWYQRKALVIPATLDGNKVYCWVTPELWVELREEYAAERKHHRAVEDCKAWARYVAHVNTGAKFLQDLQRYLIVSHVLTGEQLGTLKAHFIDGQFVRPSKLQAIYEVLAKREVRA